MRLCIVYDCLYPWTKGGAERWYRHLGDVLLSEGHTVTFVTRKQWDSAEPPVLPGAEVISVSPRTDLYHEDGRRRVAPPIWFGAGVFWHLLRNRTRYDAVHLCSFPYFTLPAARVALAGSGTRMGVDWFEYWSAEYWQRYLGRLGGTVGRAVQRLSARLSPIAFTYSTLTATRLAEANVRSVRLRGIY